ncbi:RNA-directed DNA polymerase, eukaryota, reverse transcriptase zinc-binding domain protein [Tanacetum coccineum]
MEGLHTALMEASHSGLIRGIKIGSSNITLSHIFYADDVVITTEWSSTDMDNIIRVLQVFYLASGLKINIHKSNVYGIGVSDIEVHTMANNTGCSPGSFSFIYLGLPIGANMNLTVKWPIVLASRVNGGLGIGSLKAFNLALLQKWRWRMISNTNAFWVKIVRSFNYLHSNAILPSDSIRFHVGCGTSIRFWKDLWTGSSPLYLRYNRLFRLEQDKDCLISDRFKDNQWTWNWSRSFMGDRNSAYIIDIINEVSITELSSERDVCFWTIPNDGMFSVSSTRHHIDSLILHTLDNPTQWDKTLPHKVDIFMWRFMLDRLSHRLNFSFRGIDIPTIACPSCNGNVESSNHIFFGCGNAKDIWNIIRNWCDIQFPACTSFEHWKSWFDSWQATKEEMVFVNYFFHYLVVDLEMS